MTKMEVKRKRSCIDTKESRPLDDQPLKRCKFHPTQLRSTYNKEKCQENNTFFAGKVMSPYLQSRKKTGISCPPCETQSVRKLGQIKLKVYMNYGLLTVNVAQGRHLSSKWKSQTDSFVMVSLIPDDTETTRCRTAVVMETNNPTFDDKFSFELATEDMAKRLLVTVWHRDLESGLHEFLGCTSFGLNSLTKPGKAVDGWYYLLAEDVGRSKHLQVATKDKQADRVTGVTGVTAVNKNIRRSMEELTITVHRGKQGFGFTLVESCPVRVGTVDGASRAEKAGLQEGDIVIRVNGQNVSRSTTLSVAKLVRNSGSMVAMEIGRPRQMMSHSQATTSSSRGSHSDSEDSGNASCHGYSFRDDRAQLLDSGRTSEARRQAALNTLLSIEESFVDMMHCGMQRFSRPLRHCILSSSQHAALFQNVEKLVSISEFQSRQIHDNRPSFTDDDTDGSFNDADELLNSVGMIYQSKIHMLSQAYSHYFEGLPTATRILSKLEMSTEFRNFMKSVPSRGRQLSMSTFINRPLRHIQDLQRVFQTITDLIPAHTINHATFISIIQGLQSCVDKIEGATAVPASGPKSLKRYGSGSSSGTSSSSGFGSRSSRESDMPTCPMETDSFFDMEAEIRGYTVV